MPLDLQPRRVSRLFPLGADAVYRAKLTFITPTRCRGCPFNVLAQYTTFTEAPLTGQSGFFVSPSGFQPNHNHPAPYIPMNVAAENERRKTLMHGDPSLENPPLQHALGFSGSVTSAGSTHDTAAVPSGFADGASVASTPSVAPQQLPFRQSQPPQPQTQAQPMTIPGAAYPQQQQGAGFVNGMHQGSPASGGQYGSPAPPYHQHSHPPTPASQIYGTPQSQYAPYSQPTMPYGMQQSHPPTLNGYSSASPAPPSHAFTSHPTVGRKPLEAFLLSISPQFEPYLSLFEKNNIPLDTNPQDLLDLDSGRDDDRTLFDVFKDVKQMPLSYVALAADGVRKAKKRQLMSGSREIDPRIAVGLEKANAERWVRAKIEEGHRRLQEHQQMQQVARL